MTIHYPFDLTMPGAVDQLLASHRTAFGDVRMQNDAGGESNDNGIGEARTDSPKPAPPPQPGQERRDAAQPGSSGDAEQLGDGGKRALSAIRQERDQEKARADAAEARAAELERAQMTDQERVVAERDSLREQYEQATATAAAKDATILRYEVAAEQGLTLAQARRLIGTTREELLADAEAFKAELPAPAAPEAPRNPRPNPAAGAGGESTGRATTVADARADYLAKRNRSGAGGSTTFTE